MDPKHDRNGKIGTAIFHIVLFLLFLFLGLKYQDPPPENGIAVNFGYEATGSGETSTAPQEVTQSQPEQVQPEPVTQAVETDVATQQTVDAPSVQTQEPTTQQEQPQEETEPDPQPSDRLNQILSSTRDGQESGQGITEGGGDQGNPNGDPNVNNYSGNGGTGNSGNYRLGGRSALQRPQPEYNCTDEGRVVVKVYVNRTGRVTRAVPGEAITNGPATNTFSECLFDKAREAALRTTWQGDANAPEEQIGFIIYNFQKR